MAGLCLRVTVVAVTTLSDLRWVASGVWRQVPHHSLGQVGLVAGPLAPSTLHLSGFIPAGPSPTCFAGFIVLFPLATHTL